jgi:hypothetical protein
MQMISTHIESVYALVMILSRTESLSFHNAPGLRLLANQQGTNTLFGKKNRPFFHGLPLFISRTRLLL